MFDLFQCSADCGHGVTRRHVQCISGTGNERTACPPHSKPDSEKGCRSETCGRFWMAGPWSTVSTHVIAIRRLMKWLWTRVECEIVIYLYVSYLVSIKKTIIITTLFQEATYLTTRQSSMRASNRITLWSCNVGTHFLGTISEGRLHWVLFQKTR